MYNSTHPEPLIVPRDRHHLSRRAISKNALKVLYHLHRSGFQAYLVGGGVRDILLGATPKDFDVATDAHPEQVRRIFHNCLLIGRRFRIAHVRFPGETIEVTTFRAGITKGSHRRLSASGMLLHDNVYGKLHEDVWRRDFSMNALYYNIKDFSIVDYCNGLADIQQKCIRILGKPVDRYQEDPVRLLRAIRLAAKFKDFTFESETEAGLLSQGSNLVHVPNSRLFEEALKLFYSGCAVRTYHLLRKYGLLQLLFPSVAQLSQERHLHWIESTLAHTDYRFHQHKPLSPAFLFAVLLWPALRSTEFNWIKKTASREVAYQKAMQSVIGAQQQATLLTRICSQVIQEIWLMQPELLKMQAAQAGQLMSRARFRAAYDFMLLRVECGELNPSIAAWWKRRVEQPA